MFKYIVLVCTVILLIYLNIHDKVFESKTLNVGISLPKTGIMSEWGDDVYKGTQAYVMHSNSTDILAGKDIQLTVYDDMYEPDITKENIEKMVQKNIFTFFGFVGTPTVNNIFPILENSEIPLIAPFTGANFLRDDSIKTIVNFRASYQDEVDHIIEYLHTSKQIKRIAVFYQNDDYGEDGFVSLLHALDKRKLKLAGEGTYKRNTLAIEHAYQEIKNASPQAVIMVGAYKANTFFIQRAKEDSRFKDTLFCVLSFGYTDEMIKELNYKTDNLLFSAVMPDYLDSSKPEIKAYQKSMETYFPQEKLGFISLEAYLATQGIVEAISHVEGGLTRKKFLRQIRKTYASSPYYNKVYLYTYKNKRFNGVKYEE